MGEQPLPGLGQHGVDLAVGRRTVEKGQHQPFPVRQRRGSPGHAFLCGPSGDPLQPLRDPGRGGFAVKHVAVRLRGLPPVLPALVVVTAGELEVMGARVGSAEPLQRLTGQGAVGLAQVVVGIEAKVLLRDRLPESLGRCAVPAGREVRLAQEVRDEPIRGVELLRPFEPTARLLVLPVARGDHAEEEVRCGTELRIEPNRLIERGLGLGVLAHLVIDGAKVDAGLGEVGQQAHELLVVDGGRPQVAGLLRGLGLRIELTGILSPSGRSKRRQRDPRQQNRDEASSPVPPGIQHAGKHRSTPPDRTLSFWNLSGGVNGQAGCPHRPSRVRTCPAANCQVLRRCSSGSDPGVGEGAVASQPPSHCPAGP